MAKKSNSRLTANNLAWLADVKESRHPLSDIQPIWVRRAIIPHGPSVRRPEYHPYCEICIYLSGEAIQYAGRYQFRRQPGDVFLAGPCLPHYGVITKPLTALIVYFLPAVLLNLDPQGDGARILHRFTAQSSKDSLCATPSAAVFQRLTTMLEEMLTEFEKARFGSKLKLQGLLVQCLVELLRWEQSRRSGLEEHGAPEPWAPVERALQYLREHFTDRVYAQQVAEAAGVSESQLRRLFQKTLGTSWIHYLQRYRIHRAAALLFEPTKTVTETAFAVGFEDLGHFITVFRTHMGVSPSQYIKNLARRT
ncbi:MAG: HTH-type transcriptional activator RhaR [Verrucomicrobiae bacterium]|nr:HTH-type transcriptional activator RhaR [Verrucomicrobiae bacterium]